MKAKSTWISIVLLIAFIVSVPCYCIQPNDKYISKNETYSFQNNNTIIYAIPAITNEKILPSSSINNNLISNTISISASPGEFESGSFVIHPHQDIESLLAEATDLIGENDTIPSSYIDLSVVKCWYQAVVCRIFCKLNSPVIPHIINPYP